MESKNIKFDERLEESILYLTVTELLTQRTNLKICLLTSNLQRRTIHFQAIYYQIIHPQIANQL